MDSSVHTNYSYSVGIGALYVRRRPRVRVEAPQSGGGQERGMRSGTVPTPLCVGMGAACELAMKEMEVLGCENFLFVSLTHCLSTLQNHAHTIYRVLFFNIKNCTFHWKNFDIFDMFAQNIDCGYTLEPPRRGGSNEYPQSMFWIKNKKIM